MRLCAIAPVPFARHEEVDAGDVVVTLGDDPLRLVRAAVVSLGDDVGVVVELEAPADLVFAARAAQLQAVGVVDYRDGLAEVTDIRLSEVDDGAAGMTWDAAAREVPAMRKWRAATSAAFMRQAARERARPRGYGTHRIELHGEIDENLAKRVLAEIATAGRRDILLDIDSPGGSVSHALDIADRLAHHRHSVVTRTRNALSAALVISMAGDHRVIAPDGKAMCHAASASGAGGDADALRAAADELVDADAEIDRIVARATGLPPRIVAAWSAPGAERWFTARQAVVAGLAHNIDDNVQSAVATPPAARDGRPAGVRVLRQPAGRIAAHAPRLRPVDELLALAEQQREIVARFGQAVPEVRAAALRRAGEPLPSAPGPRARSTPRPGEPDTRPMPSAAELNCALDVVVKLTQRHDGLAARVAELEAAQ